MWYIYHKNVNDLQLDNNIGYKTIYTYKNLGNLPEKEIDLISYHKEV